MVPLNEQICGSSHVEVPGIAEGTGRFTASIWSVRDVSLHETRRKFQLHRGVLISATGEILNGGKSVSLWEDEPINDGYFIHITAVT